MPRYELDIAWDGDLVSGVLTRADGEPEPFEGFLELLRLLEPRAATAIKQCATRRARSCSPSRRQATSCTARRAACVTPLVLVDASSHVLTYSASGKVCVQTSYRECCSTLPGRFLRSSRFYGFPARWGPIVRT